MDLVVAVNWLCFMKTALSKLLTICPLYGMNLVGTRYLLSCVVSFNSTVFPMLLVSCHQYLLDITNWLVTLQVSNLLYVDQPTGTGFSYTTDKRDIRHDEDGVSNDLYDFLQVLVFSLSMLVIQNIAALALFY